MEELLVKNRQVESKNWENLLEKISLKEFEIYTTWIWWRRAKGRGQFTYKENTNHESDLEFTYEEKQKQYDLKNIMFNLHEFEKKHIDSPEFVFFDVDKKEIIYHASFSGIHDYIEGQNPRFLSNFIPYDQLTQSEKYKRQLHYLAMFRDAHSKSSFRAGNQLTLKIKLTLEEFTNLKQTLESAPGKIRELAEKIVKERVIKFQIEDDLTSYIKDSWQKTEIDPDQENYDELNIKGSMRPPYEAWEELGYNKIYFGTVNDGVFSEELTLKDITSPN
jgi:hypothetical protein